MGAIAQYAYLNARVSVMAARLLPEAQVEALIEQPPERGPSPLQGAGMEGLLSEEGIDTAVLEHAWLLALMNDVSVLVRCLSGAARELLIYWLRRFELGNLKAVIRGRMAERSAAAIREELINLGPFATLRLEALLATEDVAELLRRLEATPYGDIARQARGVFEQRRDLFMLDATLDRRYFTKLAQRLRAFHGEDGRHLDRLGATIIDYTNLVWLLRYRLFYGLPPPETYYLLIPAGYGMASRDWLQLAQLNSLEEVIRALPRALSTLLENADTVSEVQRRLERETRRIAFSVLRRSAFNLGRALAYLMLRELEMQQVLGVLKGRRLRLDPGGVTNHVFDADEVKQ